MEGFFYFNVYLSISSNVVFGFFFYESRKLLGFGVGILTLRNRHMGQFLDVEHTKQTLLFFHHKLLGNFYNADSKFLTHPHGILFLYNV